VGIGIPTVASDQLGDELRDKRAEITSFFISFVVIGAYWRSHHRFWSQLKAVDNPLTRRSRSRRSPRPSPGSTPTSRCRS
jgi:uncharacterized membrane protein